MKDICLNKGFDDITSIIDWVTCTLVKSVIPLLITLAVVGFIWGIVKYFLNPDNEEKRKQGKTFMVWGLIALFVMVSMWGIIGIFKSTFSLEESNQINTSDIPHFQE